MLQIYDFLLIYIDIMNGSLLILYDYDTYNYDN
jgi:hypothetical protein